MIINHNIGLTTGKDIIVMVGRSGCGKTTTMVRCAREHYLIYMSCSNAMHGEPRELKDVNYANMADVIMQEYLRNYKYECTTQSQVLDRDYKLKSMAWDKITQEVLCRLLLLLHLFRAYHALTPEQFLRAQLNGGADYITRLIDSTTQYTPAGTVQQLLRETSRQVRRFFRPEQELIIAVDEASAADETLPNALIAPSAIIEKVTIQK